MKDRHFSLAVPWFTDAALALIQTAVPFLALRYLATELMLGTLGYVAQVVRLPICLTAGRLSEKVGRSQIIIPATLVLALACVGLANASSYGQIVLYYTISIAALGAFYPPLQALIGDVSKHGELTKNLSWFNMGWCLGGASAGLIAGWLIGLGVSVTFYVAAASGLGAALTLIIWRNSPKRVPRSNRKTITQTEEHHPSILFVARLAHFTGFFAFPIIRMLFPKLGVELGWSKPMVAIVAAMLLVGQAGGIIITSAGPWWRGKLWPQIAALSITVTCSAIVAVISIPIVIGAAFFGIGASLGIGYTSALYHGISSRRAIGKNTGIHESLVAGGNILGALFGGLVAQHISPRAPYVLLAALAGVCLLTAVILWRKMMREEAQPNFRR
ncbi:MAG TPA: MFS transporter [Armatimonadota bacterium]|nr:MFS transporter [Armatimonadota bacterium]HPP74509.1 MFS transporter [Armatimonadota bacterium]